MTQKPPEATYFNSDHPVVIMGAHLTYREALELAEKDIGDVELDYGKLISVNRWWVRHRFIREGDYIESDEDDVIPGKDSRWFMVKCPSRPKGVVRRITVLMF